MIKAYTLIILSLLTLNITAQNTTLSNGVKVSLKIETKSRFTSTSGTSEGEFMRQRFGSLENVLALIQPENRIDVTSFKKLNDYSYNVKLSNFREEQKASSQPELLTFLSEEIGFSWSFEPREVAVWEMKVVDKEKLYSHISRKGGTISMTKYSNKELHNIGTLENFAQMLNTHKKLGFLEVDSKEVSGIFDIKVRNRSHESISDELIHKYGISLEQKLKPINFLVVQ